LTLIIGVKASDGIVIGADGAATMGNVFQRTIQQPVQKLTDIDGKIIVGVAGPVGLSQQFTREIKSLHSSGKFKDESKIFAYVQEATWKHVEREWKAAKVVGDSMGQQTAMGGAMSATVIGMAVVNEPLLFQLDHKCSP
jgi:ATP-dependent protease HslVU (ClpYQ) peptidase subunit